MTAKPPNRPCNITTEMRLRRRQRMLTLRRTEAELRELRRGHKGRKRDPLAEIDQLRSEVAALRRLVSGLVREKRKAPARAEPAKPPWE